MAVENNENLPGEVSVAEPEQKGPYLSNSRKNLLIPLPIASEVEMEMTSRQCPHDSNN